MGKLTGSGRRAGLVVALVAIALVAASCSSAATNASSESTAPGASGGDVGQLPQSALRAMGGPGFANARWSLQVSPIGGGSPVYAIAPNAISGMGSNAKLFSVSTWLNTFGADSTLKTPVFAVGNRTGGTLTGDLVLRASGDMVMGGRDAGSGSLKYSIPPQPDANGLPGAKPAPGDPLAGLDHLASQVAASGITRVDGNVEIDDRLFQTWDTYGVEISPIDVNDNLVDVVSTPGGEGQPATLKMIPETKAFTLVDQVKTVAAGGETSVDITPQLDANGQPTNTLVVAGTLAADSKPLLNVYDVPDPASYARTLFIEALHRAGVATTADPTAKNSTQGLPAFDGYSSVQQVASLTSPPLREMATLIWKISYNYGANMTVCLLAVHAGSTDCTDGMAVIRDLLHKVGIQDSEEWILNGAGAGSSSTTPAAIVKWIRWMHRQPWGAQLPKMLPILGTDGSLTLAQKDSPAVGKVQAKTGTWATVDPGSHRLLMSSQALAGLMDSKSGKVYAFGLYMNGGTFNSPSDIIKVLNDVAGVAADIQQALP